MGCSREEAVLRSYWELRCERLSVEGRGALWTFLALEGQVLSGEGLFYALGPRWRGLVRELEEAGMGHLRPAGVDRWVFVRTCGVEERVRARELERRRRGRGLNGKDSDE